LTSAVFGCQHQPKKSEVQLQNQVQNRKHFKVLDLPIDTSAADFIKNLEHFSAIQAKYVKTLSSVCKGGDEKAIERHTVRNKKIFVNDRIKLLFDNDSEILEIAPLAGYSMPYGTVPRAGILAGESTLAMLAKPFFCQLSIIFHVALPIYIINLFQQYKGLQSSCRRSQ
jgi:hypothetical protein